MIIVCLFSLKTLICFQAQKPWAKLYVKVDKYKRDYHTATKNLKMAETQENNSKLDGSITQEQVNKIFFLEFCKKKNSVFYFSVVKFKKNLIDVVKKKMLLK